jgi:hypothetical protein
MFSNSLTVKGKFVPPALEMTMTFHCAPDWKEIMRIDKNGMTYKGQRIEDAGEAHRAFLKTMNQMQKNMGAV